MGKAEVEAFLTYLAKSGVSARTQNQPLAAILFMYREMLDMRFENIRAVRAKRSTHMPTVLTVDEINRPVCDNNARDINQSVYEPTLPCRKGVLATAKAAQGQHQSLQSISAANNRFYLTPRARHFLRESYAL
jgi:hypothetical protein